jgi:uroporphyrinogen decarboxylase
MASYVRQHNVPRKDLPALKSDLILRAARGERTERAPVWIMRQAGRYLPEYMELRVMADFFSVCRNPELACRVTLQPLERFTTLDALIIFCDILVIPQAMGMECLMVKGKGPVFPEPLRLTSDLEKLNLTPDVNKHLGYVFDVVNLVRQKSEGRVPVIGFCGAPWTLMAYMVEGGGTKTFHNSKPWLYNHPIESHCLLSAIAELCIVYLVGQVRAGAHMLQVFDSWGGQLGPALFNEFSLPYLVRIATGVKEALASDPELPNPLEVPMTVFAKGAHWAMADLARSEYDVIQLDWTIQPEEARAIVARVHAEETAAHVAAPTSAITSSEEPSTKKVRTRRRQVPKSLQGNLDPAAMYASEPVLRQNVQQMVSAFCPDDHVTGYIGNLGWGMQPFMKPEAAKIFIEEVQSCSTK